MNTRFVRGGDKVTATELSESILIRPAICDLSLAGPWISAGSFVSSVHDCCTWPYGDRVADADCRLQTALINSDLHVKTLVTRYSVPARGARKQN